MKESGAQALLLGELPSERGDHPRRHTLPRTTRTQAPVERALGHVLHRLPPHQEPVLSACQLRQKLVHCAMLGALTLAGATAKAICGRLRTCEWRFRHVLV